MGKGTHSIRRADLSPPLGISGGPCRIVDRILHERIGPDEKEELIDLVESDQSLSNPQAHEIYDTLSERGGPHPFTQFTITPHAQYRMDLRGVTVKALKNSLVRFVEQAKEWQRTRDPRYEQLTERSKFEWLDPKSGLFFVFGFGGGGTLSLITTYWKNKDDPSAPADGCQVKQAGHAAPAGELFGVRTVVEEKPAKGIALPLGDSIHHDPGESPKSDRERAKPQRTDTKENLDKDPPGPPVFNTPGPSVPMRDRDTRTPGEPGQSDKIRQRTPSVPGEEYGHPYKDNIYPRRTDGNDTVEPSRTAEDLNEEESRLAGGMFPSYSEKQHKQRGQAKRYYQKYYRRHKSRIKTKAKRRYKKIRNSPSFKRQRKFRNNPKYKNRFRRLPAGGVRSTTEMADRSRKHAAEPISFFHSIFGWGDITDFSDKGVVVHLDGEEEECLTIPLSVFLRGVVFESEESTDAFFETLDEVYGIPDPRAVAATFYREVYTPGWNMDPGQGAQNLGLPGPESPILDFPDEEHDDRAPGHKLDIREFDGGGGSAKLIPSGHDFANKEAHGPSAVRVAKRLAEMLDGTSKEVIQRSTSIKPKGKRFDPKNSMYTFNVPGSGGDTYVVRIKAIRKGNVTKLSKMDLLVSCSCDFWRWQGPEHWAKVESYLYGKPRGTASTPDVKDPSGDHRLCKHAAACLRSVKGWELPR